MRKPPDADYTAEPAEVLRLLRVRALSDPMLQLQIEAAFWEAAANQERDDAAVPETPEVPADDTDPHVPSADDAPGPEDAT